MYFMIISFKITIIIIIIIILVTIKSLWCEDPITKKEWKNKIKNINTKRNERLKIERMRIFYFSSGNLINCWVVFCNVYCGWCATVIRRYIYSLLFVFIFFFILFYFIHSLYIPLIQPLLGALLLWLLSLK